MKAKLIDGEIILTSESDAEAEILTRISHTRIMVVHGSSHCPEATSVNFVARDGIDHYDLYAGLRSVLDGARSLKDALEGIYPGTKKNA